MESIGPPLVIMPYNMLTDLRPLQIILWRIDIFILPGMINRLSQAKKNLRTTFYNRLNVFITFLKMISRRIICIPIHIREDTMNIYKFVLPVWIF